MAAQATVLTEPRQAPSPVAGFAQIREEVLSAYQPATAEEVLLANQIARAWFRLQQYYDLETELLENNRLPEMFETDLARFKALNSAITGAERMWRRAIEEFQRARKRRAGTNDSPKHPQRTPTAISDKPEISQPAAISAHSSAPRLSVSIPATGPSASSRTETRREETPIRQHSR